MTCKLGDKCRCVSEPQLCPNWMTPDAPAQREPGWYWIRMRGDDGVAKWDGSLWRLTGYSALSDEALEKIGPRILPPGEPDEAAVGRAILAGCAAHYAVPCPQAQVPGACPNECIVAKIVRAALAALPPAPDRDAVIEECRRAALSYDHFATNTVAGPATVYVQGIDDAQRGIVETIRALKSSPAQAAPKKDARDHQADLVERYSADLGPLRKALRHAGIAAPASDEHLAFHWTEHAQMLIRHLEQQSAASTVKAELATPQPAPDAIKHADDIPPECDPNCDIPDCPYIHAWTRRSAAPEVEAELATPNHTQAEASDLERARRIVAAIFKNGVCPNILPKGDLGSADCDYPECRDSRCEFWQRGDAFAQQIFVGLATVRREGHSAERARWFAQLRNLTENLQRAMRKGWVPGPQEAATFIADWLDPDLAARKPSPAAEGK